MARHGVYANRNAGHRNRQLALLAQAGSDWERLSVAHDAFRAAVRLLQRRRQPLGTPRGAHRDQADELVREAADYLERLTIRIDEGAFDAVKEVA